MTEANWKTRLLVAIEADGRSRASICAAAGLSRNYIGSIYTDGKEPTVPKMLLLCKALNVSPAYIISGIDASPETARLMEALTADPEKTAALAALLLQSSK